MRDLSSIESHKEQWHSLPVNEVLKKLNTKRAGLEQIDAKERLSRYGANKLETKKKTSRILTFLKQFLSPLIYILLAAALVSIVVGHYIDAVVITAVLLLNAIIGFTQEIKAETAMEALLRVSAPKAKVRRSGTVHQIAVTNIVVGDIILIESGDKVPADARLIDASNLKVNESALTGESLAVDKHTNAISGEISLADKKNMVFSGSAVNYGRAVAVVVRTGMATAIGEIAGAIQKIKPEETPLQKSIKNLTRYIIGIVIGVISILVVIGIFRGLEWLDLFLLGVAAAVSAIPEGLPAVITVVLAVGMQIMARHNAIIRKLSAVETLGSATVICSDKTGTLTLNQMTVRRLYLSGQMIEVTGEGYSPDGEFWLNEQKLAPHMDEQLNLLLRIGALCNDALLTCESDFCGISGDPTEGALVVAAAKAGINKENLEKHYPRIDEIPFQSEKQYMATLHPKDGGGRTVFIKGATEKLLSMSRQYLTGDGIIPLSKKNIDTINEASETMASNAMRVISVAYVDLPVEVEELNEENIKDKLVFVGMAGMADPPREEAKEAIKHCKEAGIKVIMITGDHKITAESVGRQLGLPSGRAITGRELRQITDEELSRQVEGISVYARTEPLQKLRIVQSLKNHGHTVAMTGDGINDAPALKSANIGVAMGITGTDVAKEASDMILADDNFVSVVSAVDEGRAIFNRLRSVIFFLLSTGLGELLALFLSILFIGEAPLLAVQIIWINLVTDAAIGIPLGLEPKYGDELQQPPRHPKVGLLFPGLLLRVAFMASLMGTGVFLVFNWSISRTSLEEARTIAFCSMVAFEWFRAFNARSDEHSVFKLGFFSNRWLLISITVAIALQMAVVYTAPFQTAFDTVPLSLGSWAIALLAGGSLFIIEEIRKLVFPRLFSLGKWNPQRND